MKFLLIQIIIVFYLHAGEKIGPDFKNPFKTFDGKGVGKSLWPSDCLNTSFQNHPLKLKKNKDKNSTKKIKKYEFAELNSQCMPSITFSWLSDGYLTKIISDYGNKKSFWQKPIVNKERRGANAFFTSFSPAATFAYGDNLVRIKFRPGIKYWYNMADEKVADHFLACNVFTKEMKDNSIFVRSADWDGVTAVEYNLCSFGPVESWSYNMKDSYDEVVREYIRYKKSNNRTGLIYYSHYADRGPDIFDQGLIDHLVFSEDVLRSKLAGLLNKFKRNGEGKIFKNPLLKKHSNHFFSNKPIYWNKLNP